MDKSSDRINSARKLQMRTRRTIERLKQSSAESIPSEDLQGLLVAFENMLAELESKCLELEADQSEQQCHRNSFELFDDAPVGYFELDQDLKIKAVNKTGASLLGLKQEELKDQDFEEFLSPGDVEKLNRYNSESLNGIRKDTIQIRIKGDGSDLLWVDMQCNIGRNRSDESESLQLCITDVSARKRESLNRSLLITSLDEQRILLEEVLNQMPAGIIIAEPKEGRVVLKNNRVDEIFGFDASNSLSLDEYGTKRKVFNLDGKRYRPEDFPLYKVIKNREFIHNEQAMFERADGSRGFLNMSAKPVFYPENKLIAGIVVFEDISDVIAQENMIKSARDFAEAIIFAIREGLVVLDSSLRVIRVNEAYQELFEIDDEYVKGRDFFRISNGIWNIDPLRKLIHELKEQDRSFENLEISVELSKAGKRILLINGRPIPNNGGKTDTLLITFRDLTKYRTAKEEIMRLNSVLVDQNVRLMAANDELEAFTYSASHDLRAPLRAMHGFSKILLDEYSDSLNDTGHHYLERISANAEKMNNLISDLLRLSRITKAELAKSDVNLSELVKKFGEELKNRYPERDVKFKIEDDIVVQGDQRLLQQAVENLLQNAWKFTREEEKAVIEFGQTSSGDEEEYYVRDNGVGFDSNKSDEMFKPFARLHSTEHFSGTGIGLSLVRRIIQRHGGKVRAEGRQGEGAVIYFSLR